MIWSPIDIAAELVKNGIIKASNRAIFIAVIGAETAGSYDETIQHVNEGGTAPGSIDRGLLAFNSKWHPEVSDECAYDGVCAIKEGVRVYREQGNSWAAWNTYKNGAYEKYLREARVAVEAEARIRQERSMRIAAEGVTSRLQDRLVSTEADLNATLEELQQANKALALAQLELGTLRGLRDRFEAWVDEIRG